MVASDRPPANGFVRVARRVYNPIGFAKGYNFVLFFIFVGGLMGFILARFQYLNFYGIFCGPNQGMDHAAPGECYYYLQASHEQVGIILHLGAIIPAGFLVCFQFVPAIRHKAIIVHRVNGYVILFLGLVGTVGALMVTRHAFGGTLATQYGLGLVAILFLGSLIMSYINVKRLQIEQHRAWMLRAWFYAGAIITLRLIMFIAATITTSIGGYYYAEPCGPIASMLGNYTLIKYPECESFFTGQNPDQHALVYASMNNGPDGLGAAFDIHFGPALWLALALHAIGVEIYLKLTPAESERLRNVSYQRQLEAGMKNPGRAGLTVDRFGDAAEWRPQIVHYPNKSSGSV